MQHTHTRQEVAAEIRDLMALLDLANSTQLAALLRNQGDTYPSSGLIRTYLHETADAAEKFVRLLRTRRAEVESQLVAGVQALTIAERLEGVYLVKPKQHIITLLSQAELDAADYQTATQTDLTVTVLASLAIPQGWLHTCEVCGRPFVARATASKVCYRRGDGGQLVCRREWRKRLRRAAANRAVLANLGDSASAT